MAQCRQLHGSRFRRERGSSIPENSGTDNDRDSRAPGNAFPTPYPSTSLRSRTPPSTAARQSGGALNPLRIRAKPGRQTNLSQFGLSKTRPMTDNMTSCI